jgi:hypothetical protein
MRILLTMVFILIGPQALAEWTYINTNDHGDRFYIDVATIRKNANARRRVWELIDLSIPEKHGIRSYRTLTEYDCMEERARTISSSGHSGQMATGITAYWYSDDRAKQPWRYIAPGTNGAWILKLVCANKRAMADGNGGALPLRPTQLASASAPKTGDYFPNNGE